MKKYLTPMTDFVLEQNKELKSPTLFEEKVFNYAKFLTQPLELWMFVPCDDDVLEIPKYNSNEEIIENQFLQYQKAQEKVLFEGFDVIKQKTYFIIKDSHGRVIWVSWQKSKTVESLLNEVTEVILTETAIKQIYGC